MNFEFATATRTLFGPGQLAELGRLAAAFGPRALLVTGASSTPVERILSILQPAGVQAALYPVATEPTPALVAQGLELARTAHSDLVIACGGGSVLDAGKAIAALLANGGTPLDYLEIVGLGRKLTQPSRPCLAIPTTAGTGAEATRNAVLRVPERRIKVSLRSALMLPTAALIDPELTHGLPPALTASSGMDALTQLIEPLVCRRANPLTDAICRQGIGLVARSLRRAYHQGDDGAARSDMALAGWLGGVALANAGLGAVHGLAGPLGGMFPAPHGALCAALLPGVMAANLEALRQTPDGEAACARYDQVAQLLTGSAAARADDGVGWVADLVAELKIPPLRSYGVDAGCFPELLEKAATASSMKANPIELSPEALRVIVTAAI